MAEACLDTDTVVELVEGRADAMTRARIEKHASRCEACRQVLSALARGDATPVPRPQPSSALPEQVGRYVITRELGAGGMGVVYAAHDPELDRTVAVKLLRGDGDPAMQERLRREAQAMAQLAHPNVVPVHDVGRFGDRIFVVMEYIEGETLARWTATRRTARAIIDAYLAAGRGLAAAHAAGIVHRDFKPENVLIGGDGRVRVADFGLARTASSPDATAARGSAAMSTEVSPDGPTIAAGALTATGAVLGTPYYIAPEVYDGGDADARSDQFSFCVALYTSLYGERPFDGDSFEQLRASVGSGRVREPAAKIRLPRRVRAAIRRGLSLRPEERFATMDELLAALVPRAQRWPWLAAAAVVACTAGGLVFALRGDEPAPCGGATEQIAAVWSPWRAVVTHAAVLATGVPYAESTWREVEPTLDRYAADWAAMHGAACRATRVRRDQPESVLELRMTCLDVRLHGLGGLVRTLGTADRTVVENAVSAAAGLPAIAECADLAALENPVRPPSPAAQREVARLEGTIAELEAQRRLGRYELTAAKALVAPVTSLGYRPLEAHLYALIAGIERDLEHFEPARDAYEHSVLAAEAGRDDRRMAGSLIELIAVVGHGLGNVKDVGPLRERARAVLERLGHPPEREAVLAEVLGDVEIEAGALDAAERDLDHAIASWEQLYGRDDLHLVEALRSRGYLDLQRERIAEARPFLERTLAIQERVLGDQHPQLGQTIQLIGDAEAGAGNYDAAAERYRRAMAIEERSVGAESAGVATLLASLANVETWRGNTDAALELVQRAIAIDLKSMGADHPITLSHQSQLASTLEAASRYADSIAVLEALLPKYRAQLGPDHQMIAYTLGSLASVELDLNKFAAARDHAREAIAMKRRLMGDDYKSYAEGRTLGVALLGLGDAAQAADVLEAADRDRDRSLDPGVVARLDADLGRALFAAGRDLPRARKLVLGAWRHIASDDRMLVERAALARWMKAHGV